MKEHRSLIDMIPNETWNKIKATGQGVVKRKNRLILDENEESVWIIESGHAVIMRSSKYAEERFIFICGPGEILNELALENGYSSIQCKALDECHLVCVPRLKLIEMMNEDAQLANAIFKSTARKMRRLYHQNGNRNASYTLEKRLLVKIWKLAKDYGKDTKLGRMVDFDVSVTLLGNMLGAKRESVSRIISRFREMDLIFMERGQLVVKNMDQLRKMF